MSKKATTMMAHQMWNFNLERLARIGITVQMVQGRLEMNVEGRQLPSDLVDDERLVALGKEYEIPHGEMLSLIERFYDDLEEKVIMKTFFSCREKIEY